MHNKVFRGSCFWRSSRRNKNWFFFRLSSSYILKKRTLFRLQNKCSKTWDLVPWWPWPIPPNTASPTASHTTCMVKKSTCIFWIVLLRMMALDADLGEAFPHKTLASKPTTLEMWAATATGANYQCINMTSNPSPTVRNANLSFLHHDQASDFILGNAANCWPYFLKFLNSKH